jgi:outer membrane receptor for ferrienterochelin and colicins
MVLKYSKTALACASMFSGLCTGLLSPASAQDIPGGVGDTATTRAPGSRLERVEILGKQPSDNDLRRRAQVAKQVYGREEMDKYGDTNVADVLKRLPGVNMQGNAPRMRGLGSGYTQVLLNGDPAPPGFALDQLSPSQVERIEVTKGPTADQSAQAVAGSINIILKDAPKVSQRDLRIGMGYNTDRPTLGGTFTFGEKWDGIALSLPVSVFEWRSLSQSVTERVQPGIDGLLSQSTQSLDQFNYGHGLNIGPRVTWRISDDETLNWQSFLQRGEWNNRSTYANQIQLGNPGLDDNSGGQGIWQNVRSNLQWVNHFSSAERIELKAGVQSNKVTYDTQTVHLGAPQRRSLGDNEEQGVTQAGNYTRLINDAHSLTVGWDLEWRQRDEKRSVTEQGVPQLSDLEGQPFSARIDRQALFVQDEWEIDKQWSTYLGLRGERINTQSQGVGAAVTNTSSVITPMWHLNYKLDPAGRDMVRGSITRSYKAAGLSQLLARPSISSLFSDVSKTNTELSPDRLGNPSLLPELATGLDIAYEKYLPAGGLISIGFFYRSITDLIRTVSSLQTVAYSPVQRWVAQPTNFSKAQTGGIELEVKGRVGELLPVLADAKVPLNVRGAVSFYRSNVEALPGPNNRLDGQQPWSGTFGFDHRFSTMPMTIGGNLGFTPGYSTQQSATQTMDQTRSRSADVFVLWNFSRTLSARFAANNLMPLDTQSQTTYAGGYSNNTTSMGRTTYNLGVEMKL